MKLVDGGALCNMRACVAEILEDARARGLRRADGVVYAPVPGCACAFRPLDTYGKHVNRVLRGDGAFLRAPQRYRELVALLDSDAQLAELPLLERDVGLLSFANGVLSLVDMRFTPYGDTPPAALQCCRVARHHIDAPYTASAETPLLDTVLDAQGFDADTRELLCALLGRLLFPVGALDRWPRAVPYLVGVGGTGKSLLLSVVARMLAPEAIGALAGGRERVFGAASLADKEVVLGLNMPAKLSRALPRAALEAMASGAVVEVARKRREPLRVAWRAPVALASNSLPDYAAAGASPVVLFKFDRAVADPQEDLADRIVRTELPNVVCRFVGAYHALRARVAAAGGDFWRAVPPQVAGWQAH